MSENVSAHSSLCARVARVFEHCSVTILMHMHHRLSRFMYIVVNTYGHDLQILGLIQYTRDSSHPQVLKYSTSDVQPKLSASTLKNFKLVQTL